MGAAGLEIIARNFTAALLRCMDLSRLPVICCPVSQRALLSVVPPARPDRKSLPETSTRLAFGCPSGATGQKIIARYFIAALLRCIDLSRLPPERSPDFHRGLLSVVPPARPDRKSLPETSTRPCFGAWICRGYPSYVARFLTASCFRLSLRRGRTENHCPKLHRALLSVVVPARPDR